MSQTYWLEFQANYVNTYELPRLKDNPDGIFNVVFAYAIHCFLDHQDLLEQEKYEEADLLIRKNLGLVNDKKYIL